MSDSRAEHLVALGNFREAAELLDAKSELTHFERVLRAWVEFELGDARQAYARASSLLKASQNRLAQAHCFAIAGRALGASGSPNEGLALLRKAITLASENHGEFRRTTSGSLCQRLAYVGRSRTRGC